MRPENNSQLLSIMEGATACRYKIVWSRGKQEINGPCPLCGASALVHTSTGDKIRNQDRFYAWIGREDGLIHWWCRANAHEFTEKALAAYLGLDIEKADLSKYTGRAEEFLPVPTHTDFASFNVTVDQVEALHIARYNYVADYWAQWDIDETTVGEMMLGYIDEERYGKRFAGFTIPHFWHTGDGEVLVKAVHIRRDDSIPNNAIPDKYHNMKGGKLGGLYYSKSFCTPDESRLAKPVTIAVLTEDERTALVLNTAIRKYGDPRQMVATSYHPTKAWDKYLGRALGNVDFKLILEDGDGGPGATRALQVLNNVGGRGVIIDAHPNYKQLSDLAKAEGLRTAWDFLEAQAERVMTYA